MSEQDSNDFIKNFIETWHRQFGAVLRDPETIATMAKIWQQGLELQKYTTQPAANDESQDDTKQDNQFVFSKPTDVTLSELYDYVCQLEERIHQLELEQRRQRSAEDGGIQSA